MMTIENALEQQEEALKSANKYRPPNSMEYPLSIVVSEKQSPDEISYLKSIENLARKNMLEYSVGYINTDKTAQLTIHKTPTIILAKTKQAPYLINEQFTYLDVDCASDCAYGNFLIGKSHAPCTAEAIIRILQTNDVEIAGANIAVIGRSRRVGMPVAHMLNRLNGTVTLFHSKSNLSNLSNYDIVISAVGDSSIYAYTMFGNNSYCVDAGMNYGQDGKMHGDLCGKEDFFKNGYVYNIGKLTTAILIERAILAQNKIAERDAAYREFRG